jgi:hypothetical protein
MVKLTASNYLIRKTRMEDILYCKELFEPIELNEIKPNAKTDDEWKKLNRKAVDILGNGLIKLSSMM